MKLISMSAGRSASNIKQVGKVAGVLLVSAAVVATSTGCDRRTEAERAAAIASPAFEASAITEQWSIAYPDASIPVLEIGKGNIAFPEHQYRRTKPNEIETELKKVILQDVSPDMATGEVIIISPKESGFEALVELNSGGRAPETVMVYNSTDPGYRDGIREFTENGNRFKLSVDSTEQHSSPGQRSNIGAP